jgi:hypothetical protein
MEKLPLSFPPFRGWSGAESTITETTAWLLYQPRMMIDDDECGAVGGMIVKGKQKYSEKTCSNAALHTINPTCSDSGSNPGRRAGKPVANRMNCRTANSLC